MAGFFSFQVVGGDAVQEGLAAVLANLNDLTPFWREVLAPKYFGVVQDLFATGGRPRGVGGKWSGGAWAPLSPAYKVWKTKHYPGKPILVREGDLKASVTWNGQQVGPGGIFIATPSAVVLGTAIPHAKYHQTGTKRMPARVFMPPLDPAVFVPLLEAWLTKAKGSSGGGMSES